MDMNSPLNSVLTHRGDSDSAVSSTIQTHTATLESQHKKVMLSGSIGVIPQRHMHYEDPAPKLQAVEDPNYPKILHSTTDPDKTCTVPDSKWEEEALETGKWSLSPMEKVKVDMVGGGFTYEYKTPTAV